MGRRAPDGKGADSQSTRPDVPLPLTRGRLDGELGGGAGREGLHENVAACQEAAKKRKGQRRGGARSQGRSQMRRVERDRTGNLHLFNDRGRHDSRNLLGGGSDGGGDGDLGNGKSFVDSNLSESKLKGESVSGGKPAREGLRGG